MASAQVVPNSAAAAASSSSRKQGHLEAGKKRLEEFRKKKAAKKAAAVVEQPTPAVPDPVEKSPPNDNSTSSADGPMSDVESSAASTTSVSAGIYQNGPIISSKSADFPSSNGPSTATASLGIVHGALPPEAVGDEGSKLYGSLSFSNLVNGYHDSWRTDGNHPKEDNLRAVDSTDKHQSTTSALSAFEKTNLSGFHSSSVTLPSWRRDSVSTQLHDTGQSRPYFSSSIGEKSEGSYTHDYSRNDGVFGQKFGLPGSSQTEESMHSSNLEYSTAFTSARGGERIVDTTDRSAKVGSVPWNALDLVSVNSDKQDPFPSTSYSSTYSRSRPSFLDSIGVQRTPPTSQIPYKEPAKLNPPFALDNSKFEAGSNNLDLSSKSGSQDVNHEKESSASTSMPFSNEQMPKHGNETFHKFTTHGKDDDFTALEQLIEDLTKEKFSLQRALETSQTLAQTLATDNSALTDNFNQQAQVISLLKSDMERLQEEIQAQLLALESVKMEYANAQLECNAADERAKVLAAEVIILEDKALRLRSNELKLEKEAKDLHSEISSYRRKVSSLEKERQDFQSTIDALLEERKLLHSKLRNLPAIEKINITEEPSVDKRDASTATEDLDTGESSSSGTVPSNASNVLEDAATSILLPNSISSIPSPEELSSGIPDDQLRMVDNINSLMSELAVEREELLRALRIESSNCSKLKELNMDLTQKLEIQTQQLELLSAQRMVNENVLAKPIDTHSINDATMYADEGDEVVERVLGWIMRLFPGGPKRRTSKLL